MASPTTSSKSWWLLARRAKAPNARARTGMALSANLLFNSESDNSSYSGSLRRIFRSPVTLYILPIDSVSVDSSAMQPLPSLRATLPGLLAVAASFFFQFCSQHLRLLFELFLGDLLHFPFSKIHPAHIFHRQVKRTGSPVVGIDPQPAICSANNFNR